MNDPMNRADVSAVSSLLRKFAHFEGETTPPATPPEAPKNGGNNGDGEAPILTEDQLKKRLIRAQESTRKKVFEELGIEDVDAAKQLLATAKKRQDDELSAVQKADAARVQVERERDEAREQLKFEQEQRKAQQRDTALLAKLNALKVKPERAKSVLALLKSEHEDAVTALLEADEPDDKAVTKLAEDARKAYPELFVLGIGSPSNAGGRAVDPGDKERQARLERLAQRTRSTF